MTDQVAPAMHVQRIARSGGLNVVGAGVGALTGFGITLVLTNLLAQDVAGTVFATTSLFLIVTAIVQLGTESGLVRWLPVKLATGRAHELNAVLRAGLLPVLLASTAVAVAVAVTAPQVADLVVDEPYVGTVTTQVRILAGFLPFAAALNVVLAATRGLRTVRPTVLVESVGRSVLQLVVVAAVAALGGTAPIVVLAWAGPYVLALLVAVVWMLSLVRSLLRRRETQPDEAVGEGAGVTRQFWAYTGPRALATIAQTVLKRSDVVLVAALRSPAEAAVYAAASRFVTLGQVGVQALQQALSPQLSGMFARDEKDEAQEVFQLTAAWSIMMAWPVYLACAVLAPTVLLVFGEGYDAGSTVVVVLSAAMLVAVASGSVDTVVLMSGRSWLSLGNTVAALVVNVGLNLFLIPRWGVLGAGVAWAVAIVVRNALPLIQVRRSMGMSPVGPPAIRMAVVSLACFAVVPGALALVGVSQWLVLAALLVGGLVYVYLLWRSRRLLQLDDMLSAMRRKGKR